MRKRNPGEPSQKSSIKNWIILGGFIAGGVVAYRYFNSPKADALKQEIKSATSARKVTDPDLNGPPVTKFEIASTRSRICISDPQRGFTYAPITSTNAVTGYNTFNSPVNGRFTRRLLCKGNQKWAEIKPATA